MATRPVSRPPWLEHDAPTAGKPSRSNACDFLTDFEFLNDAFAQPAGTQASFHLFQKLTLELRRRIWMFSLPQQRLLKVTVVAAEVANNSVLQFEADGSNDPNLATYRSENDLGNIVSGANYYLRLCSTNCLSPLLYVNHEANAVVRRVYRVSVPITQHAPSSNESRLRFCPEQDTILITVERDEDKGYFADFVHDALAYDPKKKGILHIAIMSTDNPVHLPNGLPYLHSRAQAALVSTFRGLESVSLVHLFRAKSRQMFSSLQTHFLANQIPQTEMVRFNRAYPLWSSTASYSILPVDPRPVSRYLDFVDCGWDPRGLIRAWRMLEAAYDVLPTSPNKIRVLIATADTDKSLEIATASHARRFRREEELSWNRKWEKWGFFNLHYPEISNPDNNEDIEFSKTQNAIGFWSIPLAAFGLVPEVQYNTYQWQMTRVFSFASFKSQIKLGLFIVT